jgi:hypothetical protein
VVEAAPVIRVVLRTVLVLLPNLPLNGECRQPGIPTYKFANDLPVGHSLSEH